MVIEYKAPADIKPYQKNAKRHSKEQVQKVAKSIEETTDELSTVGGA